LTLAIVGLAAACLATVPLGQRAINERIARSKARYLSMGEAARARASLEWGRFAPGHKAALATAAGATDPSTRQSLPEGGTSVVLTPLADGGYIIDAYARTNGVIQGVREVVRPEGAATPFRQAAFAVSGIKAGQVLADSYDSSLSTYGAAAVHVDPTTGLRYAGEHGTLASNASIVLSSGAVHGEVTPGPAGLSVLGSAVVSGSTAPAASVVSLSPVRVSPPATNDNRRLGSNLNVEGLYGPSSGTLQIAGGTYVLSAFYAGGAAQVHIAGDVTIYVSGPFNIGGKAQVIVDPGASLRVYATGDVGIYGGGLRNDTGGLTGSTREGLPTRVQLLIGRNPAAAAAPTVTFATHTPFYGAIYAPESPFAVLSWTTAFFGSIVADTVAASGVTAFHYDEALALGAGSDPTAVKRYVLFARWWSTF